MHRAEKITRGFGLAVPLLAFLVGILPQDAVDPWMMAPYFILAIYLLLSGRLSSLPLNDPVLLSLTCLWLGWTWGCLGSAVPFASEVTWIVLSIMPLGYLTLVNRDAEALIKSICLVATGLAGWAVLHMLTAEHHAARVKLFFEDENILGALIAMAIPVTLGFLLPKGNRTRKIFYLSCLAVLTAGLLVTQSRSAFLGASAGAGFVLFQYRSLINKKSAKIVIALVALVAIGVCASGLADRLWFSPTKDSAVMARLALWSSALRMSLIDPLHGTGLGIFHLYYPPFKTLNDNSTGFWVHMDPLQWAVETGWGTALAFYALAISVAYKFIKTKPNPLQIGAGGGLLAVFLICHAGYFFHYVPIALITGVFLSVFGAESEMPNTKIRLIPGIAFSLTVLCGFWMQTKIAPALYFYNQAMQAQARQDKPAYTENLQTCILKTDPGFPGCRLEAARFVIETAPAPQPIALVLLKDAQAANPMDPEIFILRATYYRKTHPDNFDLPMRELKTALAIDPSSWRARKDLVAVLIAQGKTADALNNLTQARNYQIPRQYLAEYYRLETDLTNKVHAK